jgi:hypothetical protein
VLHNAADPRPPARPPACRYFDVPLAKPAADEPTRPLRPHGEIYAAHSVSAWAKATAPQFPEIARKLGLDPKVFDYATWDFMDFALTRTWPDIGSLEAARSIGWSRSINSFGDGYRVVFGELKEEGVIPK